MPKYWCSFEFSSYIIKKLLNIFSALESIYEHINTYLVRYIFCLPRVECYFFKVECKEINKNRIIRFEFFLFLKQDDLKHSIISTVFNINYTIQLIQVLVHAFER